MPDDNTVFRPLSTPLLARRDFPEDVFTLINTELRSTLTLRSLVHLCTACKQTPTAPMLAFALQNSIPSLTGLPMDNPNPKFYIEIAEKFYDKRFGGFEMKVDLYRRVHNYNGKNYFFPAGANLYGDDGWHGEHAIDFYVRNQIIDIGNVRLGTYEGRKLSKELMLEWRKHYEGRGPEYHDFIDRIIRILDHGFFLSIKYREICTGIRL